MNRAPRDPMTHLALGMAFTAAGDGEKAISAFEAALELEKGSVLTLGLLANAYLNLDRYDLGQLGKRGFCKVFFAGEREREKTLPV